MEGVNVPNGGPLKKDECCIILSELCVYPVTYCRKKTEFRMVLDDDRRWVRKYAPWCPDHIVQQAKLDSEEE